MPRPLVGEVLLVAALDRGSVDEYSVRHRVMVPYREAVHAEQRHTTMFGFRDISHDVCNVLIHVSGLRSLLFICYVYDR